jgi:hypothetical protein
MTQRLAVDFGLTHVIDDLAVKPGRAETGSGAT